MKYGGKQDGQVKGPRKKTTMMMMMRKMKMTTREVAFPTAKKKHDQQNEYHT
jgi:hypothetical protein